MKKSILIITLLICLILIPACSNKEASNSNTQIAGISGEQDGTTTLEQSDSETQQNSETQKSTPVNTTISKDVSTGKSANTVTVLAKSNNTVSDAEKQAVLTQLESEMDGLLETVNGSNLDEVQASDLSY